LGVPRQKGHLDVGLAERHREYYMGEGGGFPRVWAMVSFVSPKSLVVRPSTKGVVATLVLGSRPKQRGCKGAGQEKARESHHILLGV
jgi:hypothetical protein